MAFQAVGAASQAYGASKAAGAQKRTLLYDAAVDANNSEIAEWQAKDALRMGADDEQAVRMNAAAVKASQRVSMAANGIDLNEGSAVDVQTSTDYMAELDAKAAKNNALKNAWGYRTQGTNYQASAAMKRSGAASINPGSAAALSLLGSSGQVADSWYKMKKAGVE